MANKGFLKVLKATHDKDASAFTLIHDVAKEQKNTYVHAHCMGALVVINGVSPETQALIDLLQDKHDKATGDKRAGERAILLESIANLGKVDWDSAADTTDAITDKAKGKNTMHALPTDSVILCAVGAEKGAPNRATSNFLFGSVDATTWFIVSFDMVSRHASVIARSGDMPDTVDSEHLEINSPSRARQACATMVRDVVTKTETIGHGKDALAHCLAHGGWHNMGGVGTKNGYKYGAYAMLLSGLRASKLLSLVEQKQEVPQEFKYVKLDNASK